MKSTVRLFLIWIFLCNGFSVNAQHKELFSYADSLYLNGSFKLAAVEYERIIYYSADKGIENLALYKKSLCYKQDKQYLTASNTLKRIHFNQINDTLYEAVCLEYALNCYLNGDYAETLMQLNEMKNKNADTMSNQYVILKILTVNELKEWNAATECLKLFTGKNNLEITASKLDELTRIPRLKNEKFAMTISYFIPGSGQIYCGYWGKGISSLFFTGVFAGYTYISIINGYYFTSFFTGFSGFRMFWTGGAKYAGFLANEKNKKKISTYNNKIKTFILNKP